MIITCPECRTRYRVAAEAVEGPRGRKVRCAGCGHVWLYRAETEASAAPQPEPPPLRVEREPLPAMPPRPVPDAEAPRRLGWTASLIVVVLLVAVLAGGILARDRIAAAWPPAARFYRALGIKIAASGAGLRIGDVAPVRSGAGLIVEGDITNTSGASRAVPRLRVALRDAGHRELAFKVIAPPQAHLPSGAIVHFAASFDHASDRATGVAVTFVPG